MSEFWNKYEAASAQDTHAKDIYCWDKCIYSQMPCLVISKLLETGKTCPDLNIFMSAITEEWN